MDPPENVATPTTTITLTVDAGSVCDMMALWYLLHEPNAARWPPVLCTGFPTLLGFWLGRIGELLDDDDRFAPFNHDWDPKEGAYVESLVAVDRLFLGPDHWRVLADHLREDEQRANP